MEVLMITKDLKQMIEHSDNTISDVIAGLENTMSFLANFKGAERAEQAHKMYENSFNRSKPVDRALESSGLEELPCTAGCSYCCHQYIAAAPEEADLLYQKIKERNISISIKKLQYQAKFHDADTYWEKFGKKTACTLLDEHGKCRLYKYRPLSCRALYAAEASSKYCKPGEIDPHQSVRYVANMPGALAINAMLNLSLNENTISVFGGDASAVVSPLPKLLLDRLK